MLVTKRRVFPWLVESVVEILEKSCTNLMIVYEAQKTSYLNMVVGLGHLKTASILARSTVIPKLDTM